MSHPQRKIPSHWWYESCDLPPRESGSQVRRLTSAPAISTNVYCEQPYCSADGNYVPLLRTQDIPSGWRLMLYDIERYNIGTLEPQVTGVATSAYSGVLFVTAGPREAMRLVRWDLNSREREELFEWGDIPGAGLLSVSPDLRYGISTGRTANGFSAVCVDLQNGQWDTIFEGTHICNPHFQYRLFDGGRIGVLENRGCAFAADGRQIQPFDERGPTLFSMAADGSDRREFPIGLPATPWITGHYCWAGDSGHILATLAKPHDDGQHRGTVLELSHDWEEPRVLFDTDNCWNHVSASRCGRFFVVDSYELPGVPIMVGSVRTGKTQVLCDSGTSGGGGQHTHAHPYITSDNRFVVFVSDVTGLSQTYIASIPDRLLESLDDA